MSDRLPLGPELAARVAAVRRRVADACARSGRSPDDVTIVGVGKTHPPDAVQALVDHGIVDIGENRVEEFTGKYARVTGARWHFVGQLQSRKANDLVGLDVLIHSVDRRSLVERLQRLADRDGVTQELLVQVNVGDDPAKGGCRLEEVDALVAYAQEQPNLTVRGLMTIPPLPPAGSEPVEAARGHFARLRELRDGIRREDRRIVELSMGMTADLESAVEEGATMVRVGTALFGERGPEAWAPTGEAR